MSLQVRPPVSLQAAFKRKRAGIPGFQPFRMAIVAAARRAGLDPRVAAEAAYFCIAPRPFVATPANVGASAPAAAASCSI
ncbi:hypothetical protein X976_2690 [Burkholderia pseudomallei MSHR7500]|nr:hypothetical protein X976_2690 [Burkholderia pseudomallei MSHR7500]